MGTARPETINEGLVCYGPKERRYPKTNLERTTYMLKSGILCEYPKSIFLQKAKLKTTQFLLLPTNETDLRGLRKVQNIHNSFNHVPPVSPKPCTASKNPNIHRPIVLQRRFYIYSILLRKGIAR